MTTAAPLILVAEDSEDLREAYVDWFTFKGFRAAAAASGPETVDLAFSLGPAIVVMDLSLPRLDGFEVARRLRADPRTASTPLIALTGHSGQDVAQRAREAGFACYLLKPCLPDRLLVEIARLLA